MVYFHCFPIFPYSNGPGSLTLQKTLIATAQESPNRCCHGAERRCSKSSCHQCPGHRRHSRFGWERSQLAWDSDILESGLTMFQNDFLSVLTSRNVLLCSVYSEQQVQNIWAKSIMCFRCITIHLSLLHRRRESTPEVQPPALHLPVAMASSFVKSSAACQSPEKRHEDSWWRFGPFFVSLIMSQKCWDASLLEGGVKVCKDSDLLILPWPTNGALLLPPWSSARCLSPASSKCFSNPGIDKTET